MIVETMTYQEICREFDRIKDEFFLRSIHKTDERKIRQYMRAHRDEQIVYFKPVSCRVDNTSHFVTIPFSYGYKDYKSVGLHGRYFLIYKNRHGLNTVMTAGYHNEFHIFITSHFYQRYNERLLHDDSASKMDLIPQCIINADFFVFKPFPVEGNPNNYIGVTQELIVFAERIEEHILIVKTCVTSEQAFASREKAASLLYDDLIEYSNSWNEIVKHYNNTVIKKKLKRYKFR